jgi:hypothetical protein
MSNKEKNYITDKLFYFKNNLYYEDKNNIKINNLNWHKYLSDYGWTKLSWGWKKRLKSKDKNFRFGVIDCGSNGDCLFHSIAEAFNDPLDNRNCKYDSESLRKQAADQINKENFLPILESYKLELETLDFFGDWDPLNIKNIQELKKEIMKSGDNFWGDHIILQLLQKSLKFNVIILNSKDDCSESKNIKDQYKINPLANDINKYNKTIILYYLDKLHFQLIGYFNNNKMTTVFSREHIPEELLSIYMSDCNLVSS